MRRADGPRELRRAGASGKVLGYGLLACLAIGMALLWPARLSAARGPAGTTTLSTALHGRIVQYGLSGFEPDFDPIDRVVIAATLHDRGTAATALPDSMLVLSTYLENFQPDTTPILPDLLHPNQTATSLGGFMQGKAALVNAAGQISYQGSMLAEVFLDNSVHLVLDLQRRGAPATAPSLRLRGIFTLDKSLAVHGTVDATRTLSPAEADSLRVRQHHTVSWQSIVRGLTVRKPKMMGTAGNAGSTGTAQPAAAPLQQRLAPATPTRPIYLVAIAGGLLVVIVALLLWWRRGRVARSSRAPWPGTAPPGMASGEHDEHAS